MATTDKPSKDKPESGQPNNGTVVVREELRIFLKESLGFTEVETGSFRKADPEGAGTLNVDFRPTGKNVNGHPKGRIYIQTPENKYINDEKTACETSEPLGIYRLFQQKIWADKDLDGNAKKVSHEDNVAGDIENPVKEELQVGSKSKPEPVKEPEIVSGGAPVAKQETPADRDLPSTTAPEVSSAAGKNVPAVREAPKAIIPWKGNEFDVVKVNDIVIPNQYLVFYQRKLSNGKQALEPYIKGEGLEYLAGKMGLWKDPRGEDPSFPIEKLQSPIGYRLLKGPNIENEWGAKGDVVMEGYVRMADGQFYTNIASATSKNLNTKQQSYPLEMAVRRAKNRAIRTATNCNICSLEEADLDPKNIIDAEFTVVSGGGN